VSLTITAGPGKYELPAAGPHPAALVAAVDLGSHVPNFKPTDGGEARARRLLALAWELVNIPSRPVLVQQVGFSLHQRSHLSQLLRSWLGREIRPNETVHFDDLLGKPALLVVQHRVSQAGRPYAIVGSISPPLSGMTPTPPRHKLVTCSIGDRIPDGFDDLPWLMGRSLHNWIETSVEYRQLLAARAGNAQGTAGTSAGTAVNSNTTGTSAGTSAISADGTNTAKDAGTDDAVAVDDGDEPPY
jgi:hypothetical protein